ncbi:MAG: phytoene desaturase family protein [Anaerolineae bacterium]
MPEKSLIIIGAGLSGLSAGCYAQMNGYRSRIFEHHTQPGGVAAWWKRGEYLIDGGIHFVMNHRPGTGLHNLYQELGIVPGCRFVDLPGYGTFIHEASGRSVRLGDSLDQWSSALKALSPADARIVDEIVAGGRALQGLDMSTIGMSRPPELSGALDQAKELWAMRGLLRFMLGKYSQTVAKYGQKVRDPVLRTCLEQLFLPGVPLYFIFMIMALLADKQLGLIEGGSRDFVRAIEERYKALGGEITYRATVDEILVENDRATGVRLADGSEHRADAVVSAADGRSTIYQMLGGRYVDAKIERRYATWKVFQPLCMISYGVARTFPELLPFTTISLEEPLAVGPEAVRAIMLRTFNYGPQYAPPGTSVLQAEFESSWDHWNDLRREDRAAYNAEKDRIADQVLARLESHLPGISSQVEVVDVSTPYTTWRYTRNDRGSWGGWLMTPEAMTKSVGRTLPGLSGFAMAGQWVMPGGGVPACLYSGQHVVQLLCHHDGKPFRTTAG